MKCMMCGGEHSTKEHQKALNVEINIEKDALLYAMARHIRNVDGIHPSNHGLNGGKLLMRLRLLDGEKYDGYVLRKASTGSTSDTCGDTPGCVIMEVKEEGDMAHHTTPHQGENHGREHSS